MLQTDRESNFGYTFGNLPFGRPVTVTLYFMENYWPAGDSSVTGDDIYRGMSPGGEGATPYVRLYPGTTFIDTGLTDGRTYYYKVSAVNYSGESPLSAETGATPNPWPVPGELPGRRVRRRPDAHRGRRGQRPGRRGSRSCCSRTRA